MWPLVLLAAGIALASRRRMESSPKPKTNSDEVRELIRAAAARYGVPAAVALAFADVESSFNPRAEGDRDWPTKRPDKYRELVLERRATSPYAGKPELWHSYGLFQLHAAHHAQTNEDPRALLDPQVNTERAMRTIKRLLERSKGDPYSARLAYVGCGFEGQACSAAHVAKVRERLRVALERWGG